MKKDFEQVIVTAMRTSIRKHPRAKLWAEVNCEDNFSLAIFQTAESACLEIVTNALHDDKVVDWFNDKCSNPKKLKDFVLTTCREMYTVLRT